MPTAALGALDLHYERPAGPADDRDGLPNRPPLVLLHGATETFRVSWRRQLPFLTTRFDIIGPDMRGHGRSSNPAGELDLRRMADDVVDLLDHLRIDTAHVCGFSGGASTALYMALRRPERLRSAVLIANNFELDEARLDSGFWDLERIRERDALWLDAMRRWHAVPPETLIGWWADEDRRRPALSHADLAGISLPVLVVAGDRDPIVPLRQSIALFEAVPDSELLVVPGVGHGIPHGGGRLLGTALAGFIEDVERARRGGHGRGAARTDGDRTRRDDAAIDAPIGDTSGDRAAPAWPRRRLTTGGDRRAGARTDRGGEK